MLSIYVCLVLLNNLAYISQHPIEMSGISPEAAEGFDTHSRIVVGTLPETGFVVEAIDAAVGVSAPIPLPFRIDEIVGDIPPTLACVGEPTGCLFALRLVVKAGLIELAYHVLGLYPPMAVGIQAVRFGIGVGGFGVGGSVKLVYHAAVGLATFEAGEGYLASVGECFGVESGITDHFGRFEHEPGGFDVVTVRFGVVVFYPVVVEEESQVMGLGVFDTG